MKAVVIGIGSGTTMEAIMALYRRHKAVVDAFVARGEAIGIGPFTDRGGNLAIFRSREAAQAFVKQAPSRHAGPGDARARLFPAGGERTAVLDVK